MLIRTGNLSLLIQGYNMIPSNIDPSLYGYNFDIAKADTVLMDGPERTIYPSGLFRRLVEQYHAQKPFWKNGWHGIFSNVGNADNCPRDICSHRIFGLAYDENRKMLTANIRSINTLVGKRLQEFLDLRCVIFNIKTTIVKENYISSERTGMNGVVVCWTLDKGEYRNVNINASQKIHPIHK